MTAPAARRQSEDPGAGSTVQPPPPDAESIDSQSLDATVASAVRKLFGRDSLYMVIWALQVIAAAAVTPVVTRLMGRDEFGGVAGANAVMQVLFVIAGFGLSTAIQREFAKPDGPKRARRLMSFAIGIAVVVTLLVDATGSAWSAALGFKAYAGAVRLAVFWAGASAVTNSALALLRSRDRLLGFALVSLLQSIVAEVASLTLVAAVSPTATMFVAAQLGAQLLALGLGLSLVPPAGLRRVDAGVVREALRYGVPLIPALLSTFALNSADRFIVQSQLGPGQLARYQIAYNIGSLPMLLVGLLNTAWLPRIFTFQRTGERTAVIAASRNVLYGVLTPVVIGLSTGAPLLLRVWAPPAYRPDDLLLVTALVIVAVIPFCGGLTTSRALLAEGLSAPVAVVTVVAAIANIGLNLVLVPPLGLAGSALATLVAYVLLQAMLVWWARDVARVAPPPLMRRLELGVAAGAAVAVAALPTSNAFLVARAVGVMACVAWFLLRLLSVNERGISPGRMLRRSQKTA